MVEGCTTIHICSAVSCATKYLRIVAGQASPEGVADRVQKFGVGRARGAFLVALWAALFAVSVLLRRASPYEGLSSNLNLPRFA